MLLPAFILQCDSTGRCAEGAYTLHAGHMDLQHFHLVFPPQKCWMAVMLSLCHQGNGFFNIYEITRQNLIMLHYEYEVERVWNCECSSSETLK